MQGRGFFQVGAKKRQGVEAGLNLRQGSLLAFAASADTDATCRDAFTLGAQGNPVAGTEGVRVTV